LFEVPAHRLVEHHARNACADALQMMQGLLDQRPLLTTDDGEDDTIRRRADGRGFDRTQHRAGVNENDLKVFLGFTAAGEKMPA